MRKPIHSINQKLHKVNSNFTVELTDNGFLFSCTGESEESTYVDLKLHVATLDELMRLIKELSELPTA